MYDRVKEGNWDSEILPASGDETVRPLFDIRSLVYAYPDGRSALKGIDLTIHRGDRIALVGQNGAGKTTLALHLNGLFRPRSGTIFYEGLPLDGDYLRQARLQIGMLFQDPDDQLFCNTLDEDVAFGPQNQELDSLEVENRVANSLKEVGLLDLRFKAPHRLSYGQKKRAALAAILAMNPEVLILDEPTANLDPKQENMFAELLRQFRGTLICISHDLPLLYGLCSRAVVMEDGRIDHDFSMQELVSHKKYLRAHGLDFTFRLSCCRGDETDHDEDYRHSPTLSIAPDTQNCDGMTAEEALAHDLIRMHDYRYLYPDGTWGIRGVELAIREGESVAILGENGAGKSTLVSCMAGILGGDGQYFFDGRLVSKKGRNKLWRHIGMVFQDPADQLFCPSCREEVAFGPKQLKLAASEVDARVEEALAQVRLTGFEDRVPNNLSAGERKRLALASVLSMRPRALIIDEPTANLDPQNEELFCDILRQLSVTKILISHDMDIISLLGERIVVMHRGRLIRDYSASTFMKDEHLISVNGLDYTLRNDCCREIMKLQQAD
ncbi:MAG: energy-coupling factor ABC transporter ATP-binding protein [Deltaproteobacteria bacterium]|nr:energy-coupling factor ABC transporter ATP-binding protein [Deltaproteobacteria bacterium]MBF0524826.1 energy-coupling factor ABC transporter ATP-binding protein [Deltaproteobacteria bacterium]